MKSASEHAISLLTSWKRTDNSKFLLILLKEDEQFTDIQDRAQDVWFAVSHGWPHSSLSIEQMADVIEALFVLKYKEAHLLCESLFAYLADQEIILLDRTESYRQKERGILLLNLYAAAIAGVVGASVWADKASVIARPYTKDFPTILADLLSRFARSSMMVLTEESSGRGSSVLTGRFEEVLGAYFLVNSTEESTNEERFRRAKNFFARLNEQGVSSLPNGCAIEMLEVVMRKALTVLPLDIQVEMLTHQFQKRSSTQASFRDKFQTWVLLDLLTLDFKVTYGTLVFASVEDANSFLDFYRLALALAIVNAKDGHWLRGKDKCPEIHRVVHIPQAKTHRTVFMELDGEAVALIYAMAENIFREHGIDPSAQVLPKIGQKHGAITFEWSNPIKVE